MCGNRAILTGGISHGQTNNKTQSLVLCSCRTGRCNWICPIWSAAFQKSLWHNRFTHSGGFPGKADITLSEAGKYTIFHEYQSVVGNKVYKTEEISGLQCALTSQETGAEIALSSPSGSSTYTLGGRAGRSLWAFSIDKPGNYQISAWYPEDQEGQEVVLAIGSGFTGKIVGTVFSSLAILFGSIAIAVVITVVTAIKREKAIKRLKTQNT